MSFSIQNTQMFLKQLGSDVMTIRKRPDRVGGGLIASVAARISGLAIGLFGLYCIA